MKRFSLILISLCMYAAAAIAQNTITGRTIDEKGEPIVGSTVIMQKTDSTYVNGCITDSLGHFSLAAETMPCRIVVSNLSYESKEFVTEKYNVGDIIMKESHHVLDSVVVKAERPLVTMVNGRLNYDVTNILKNKSVSNAHEVLKHIPGIYSPDGTNITLAGANSVTVIVSGKRSNMSVSDLMDYLKSMPAERVEKVEVIYDAPPSLHVSGAAINVVLKRIDSFSLNGQVSAYYTNNYSNSESLRGATFVDTKKWAFYGLYGFYDLNWKSKGVNDIKHTVNNDVYNINETTKAYSNSLRHNLYGSVSYKPTNKSSIELAYSGNFTPKSNGKTFTKNNLFDDANSYTDGNDHYNDVFLTYSSDNMNAGVEYMDYISKSLQDMEYLKKSGAENAFKYNRKQYIDKLRAYVDMSHTIKNKYTIVYGLSYNFVKNNNRLAYNDVENNGAGNYISESMTKEHTGKAYAGIYANFFKNKLMASVIFSDEYYKINDYKRNSFNPYANITYTLTPKHIFQLTYNSYVSYPSYWDRQVYTTRNNEYSVTIGNPDLTPMKYHMVNFNYILMNKYVFQMLYVHVNDFITYQFYQDENQLQQIIRPTNVDFTSLLQFAITAPVSIGKWYTGSFTVRGAKSRYKWSNWYGHHVDKSILSGSIVASNSFTLSKKPDLQLDIFAYYMSPTIVGIVETGAQYSADATLKYTFAKKKAILSLNVNDIFESNSAKSKIRFKTQHADINNKFYLRSVTVSFTYKFRDYKDRTKSSDTSRFGM